MFSSKASFVALPYSLISFSLSSSAISLPIKPPRTVPPAIKSAPPTPEPNWNPTSAPSPDPIILPRSLLSSAVSQDVK